MNKSDRKEASKFLLDRCIDSRIQNGRVERYITHAHDCATVIVQIEGVVREINKSNKILFRTNCDKRTGYVTYFEEECGRALRMLFQYVERYIFSLSAPLRLNPLVRVFIDACNKFPEVLTVRPTSTVIPFNKQHLFCLLNDFVGSIRSMSKTPRSKSELDSVSRAIKENRKSVSSFFYDCLAINKQASFLEIDLFCSKARGPESLQKSIARYTEIQKHRSHWTEKIKRRLPKGCFISQLWRIIYSLNQDWRISVIVVLDTSFCTDVANVVITLETAWQEVTQGGGFGVLSRFLMNNTQDLSAQLNVAVKRLTYPEYFVQTIAPNGGRTMGHSEIPKRK